MATLDVGSYSSGTLRDSDIAEALHDMLKEVGHDDAGLMADLETVAMYADADDDDERDNLSDRESDCIENAADIITDALDALQEYAPPFCYVGFHEGDGADLGVWFNDDAFDEACRCGEVLKIGDSSELDSMSFDEMIGVEYIAIVSDHGNVTIYRPRIALGEEVMGIV